MQQQLPEIKQLGRKLENSRLDLETARSSSNNAREKFQSLQQQAAELGEPTEPSASAAPGAKLSPLQQAREQMEATRAKADEQEQRLLEIKACACAPVAMLTRAHALAPPSPPHPPHTDLLRFALASASRLVRAISRLLRSPSSSYRSPVFQSDVR